MPRKKKKVEEAPVGLPEKSPGNPWVAKISISDDTVFTIQTMAPTLEEAQVNVAAHLARIYKGLTGRDYQVGIEAGFTKFIQWQM